MLCAHYFRIPKADLLHLENCLAWPNRLHGTQTLLGLWALALADVSSYFYKSLYLPVIMTCKYMCLITHNPKVI